MSKALQKEVPRLLDGPDFNAESGRMDETYTVDEAKVYAELDAFAKTRSFALSRENGRLVLTLLGVKGIAVTDAAHQHGDVLAMTSRC